MILLFELLINKSLDFFPQPTFVIITNGLHLITSLFPLGTTKIQKQIVLAKTKNQKVLLNFDPN